ncbi:MAG: DEAD/DEAH box helicase [Planctomycetaceae bacterium]|nr:DEAD/DEAH box helicase [Planctomycetaceae bacterium]
MIESTASSEAHSVLHAMTSTDGQAPTILISIDDLAFEAKIDDSDRLGVCGGSVPQIEPPNVLEGSCRVPNARVFSHVFPESPQWLAPKARPQNRKGPPGRESANDGMAPVSTEPGSPPATRTRIKPPKDLLKWTDRLYYLLQPPLESLLSSEVLDFPFQPFQHQMEGVAFLFPRQAAILADEMGLGKTMQAITAIRMLLHAGHIRNVLLICPKPLVTNWQREFAAWAPEIPLGIVEGDTQKRAFLWQQQATPVKIANYELLMRDQSEVLGDGRHYDLVVLDEAQRVKNSNSTTAQTIRQISRQRSWALTGTPIENSVNDLHGLFEFLMPGYLPPGLPIEAMAREVGDYVLRRTKDLVMKDMPPRLFRDALLELTPQQLATYREAEETGVLRLSDLGEQLTIQHVFQLVLRLKQICNFDPVTGASMKLQRLEADMEEVASSGQKAIVFTQWVKTIDQMRPTLERFGPLEYHGRIPSKQRDPILKQFKEDPSRHVLLMSYGAGSVGLNLQFCRYVFLFDRWWNPAIEDQAINRAHRIGAAGSVTITRMTSEGTIEERIHSILEEKRQLFETLFSATNGPKNLNLTRDEIFGLFKLRAAGKRIAA